MGVEKKSVFAVHILSRATPVKEQSRTNGRNGCSGDVAIKQLEQTNTPMKNKLYLGLDVHQDSITIAIAVGRRNGEVRLYGAISNDLHAIEKALSKIRQAHGGAGLEVCYEAGPCGFGIARRLAQLKVACLVVAPSMIPKRSGDRVKTDKRDARKLARLLRNGRSGSELAI